MKLLLFNFYYRIYRKSNHGNMEYELTVTGYRFSPVPPIKLIRINISYLFTDSIFVEHRIPLTQSFEQGSLYNRC